jgi:sec-independent protein translocase protein TatA
MPEIIVVLVVVLLLFGGKKLPELARGLARGLKAFRHEIKDVKDELTSSSDEDAPKDTDDQPPRE